LLIQNQLIDEFRLMVFPIIIRSGKKLFKDGIGSIPLRLLETRPVGPEGVIVITYMPREKVEKK
jgi:dihydrofolate reductase